MDTQHQPRRTTTTTSRVLEHVAGFITMTLFALFFAWIVINWLMGCGESFPQADGTRVMGECLSILPWRW